MMSSSTEMLSILCALLIRGSLCCYFPIEYQGTFLMQTQAIASSAGSTVTYSEITIEADSIPPWGECHKKTGNNVILRDSFQDCMRCFHLTLKSPNVIEMHTEGLARCYTNEDAARATCPTEKDVRERKFKEIMLFRKHVPGGLESVQHVFCPINGRYRFNYMAAQNANFTCDQSHSYVSNCPHGNRLDVQFRQCSFPNMDTHFLCLGDWPSPNGDRYLALMDLREEPQRRPKYRCGLYREDPKTGHVYVSMSSDSTCMNHLKSPKSGFESFILTPVPEAKFPMKAKLAKCRFPEWTQGKWEKVKIEGNSLTFKDELNQFRTLNSKCIQRQNNTPNDRFIIFSRNQCGKDFYTCVWMKRRSPNILEFQFGAEQSPGYSDHLCDDTQFLSHAWVTQGRRKIGVATPCPITGDYFGVVPGVNGICAKVASDCNNPDIMFYTVSSCQNRSHIFEERVYRCLGNWQEDGSMYTYTRRRDMPGHQCFAGKIVKDGNEAFIKEAGENCIRGEDPMIFGMKIVKQANCPRLAPVTSYIPMSRNKWNNNRHRSKVVPHQPQLYPLVKPMSPPAVRRLPLVPSQSRPAVTRDPHWYQADLPSTKAWNPITTRVKKGSKQQKAAENGSARRSLPSYGFLVIALIVSVTLLK